MAEHIHRNGRVGEKDTCIFCGTKKGEHAVDDDHMYPRCLIRQPKELRIDPSRHPMRGVIHDDTNKMTMCRDLHVTLDKGKEAVFKGRSLETVDPEALVRYLMDFYPITPDLRYALAQVENMMSTNGRFVQVVCNLNGEFPKPLVRKFGKAAGAAMEFNQQLDDLLLYYNSIIKIENLDQGVEETPEYMSETLTYSSLSC